VTVTTAGSPPELPYHRLLHSQPTYRWWRPLVALVLLAAFILVGTLVVLVIGMFIGIATGAIRTDDLAAFQDDLLGLAMIDAASPLSLVIGLGSVAIWLPCVPLALLCAGIRPVAIGRGIADSVQFRLRWSWLLACLGPAAVVMVVTMLATTVLFPLVTGEWLGPVTTAPAALVLAIALIVLIVPFQAAAEEYVFRGVFTQAIGGWIRWTPIALVVPTVLFAFGHLYDAWGLLDVATFGIAAAVVTWRTGGLEAAIAMHSLNNITLFALLATGSTGGTAVTSDAGSPAALGVTLVTMAGYVLWIDRMATRRGLQRRAIPVGTPVASPVATRD
jgi:membrane protease YdiL (CAAX protease family)